MGYRLRQGGTNFTAGELSATLAARSDVKLFKNGAEKLLNMRLLAQGGARTRPALVYLNTILGSVATVKLAPFVFNATQRYVFAFSDARVDIYLPDGTLATSLTGAPWTADMLDRFTWTQFGDTVILCHPDMPMQLLKRTGATTFTLSNYTFENNSDNTQTFQPYENFAPSGVTLTPSGTTGSVSLTLSSPGAFVAGHVGTIIRYRGSIGPDAANPNPLCEILITAVTDAEHATGTVRHTLDATTATADWDEQVFSSVRGYANCADFYNNRLVFGGAKSKPTGIWLSKIGAYFNFDLGTGKDNEAIWESISGPLIVEIRHVVGGRHLLIWSDRALFYVPTSTVAPLTPQNFEVRQQQPYGANFVKPEPFDSAVLFCQSTGAVIREALWVDTAQAYSGDPISLLSSHLILSPKQMGVLYGGPSRPEQYALLVNDDGSLAVFHSVRSEDIAGWVPWASPGGDGLIQSICAADEEVFVAVQRTIAGGTVITLEKFDDDSEPLDCCKTATSGTPTKTFSGFNHLAGLEVQAASNGHPLGPVTVGVDGVITLGDLAPSVETLTAGFPFTQTIRPMPARFDLPDGPSTGLIVGLVRTMIQLDTSASVRQDGQAILLNFAGDDFLSSAPTKTGIVEVHSLGYDKDGQRDIIVSDPAKVTVLGLVREVAING